MTLKWNVGEAKNAKTTPLPAASQVLAQSSTPGSPNGSQCAPQEMAPVEPEPLNLPPPSETAVKTEAAAENANSADSLSNASLAAPDPFEGIELPDTANVMGPSKPNWMSCYDVKNYLVHGDDRERVLATHMLEVLYETIGHIELVVKSRTRVEAAEEHMASACAMSKTLLSSMSNLVAHRTKGVQHFTKIVGPAVGLQAKIENALNPAANTPEALLVSEVLHMSGLFRRLVEYFSEQELIARDFEADDAYRRAANAIGLYLPERENMKRWVRLGIKAYAHVAAFDKAAIELARARRQVMIVEEGPVPGAEPARREPRATRVRRRAAA